MPGAQLTGVEDDVYQGLVKVKVGPVTAQYRGTASFVEKDDDAYHAVISAKGKEARGSGTAAATIDLRLRPEGDASTVVTVDTDLKISGKIAQFGSGMIKEVSAKLLGQFVACLEQRISSGGPDAAAGGDDDAAPAADAARGGRRGAGPGRRGGGGLVTGACGGPRHRGRPGASRGDPGLGPGAGRGGPRRRRRPGPAEAAGPGDRRPGGRVPRVPVAARLTGVHNVHDHRKNWIHFLVVIMHGMYAAAAP